MENNLYVGLGTDLPFDELMQMLNDAFDFTASGRDFRNLLPKLYRPEARPQDENHIVSENGKCVASVGAYSHTLRVCGVKIPCRGVGNVAVLKEARSKGYMNLAMKDAMDKMVRDGVALSTLGGRRQRYRYFGYEKIGPLFQFSIARENIRHTYGTSEPDPAYALTHVTENDKETLHWIHDFAASDVFAPVRAEDNFLRIAETWHNSLWLVRKNGEAIGYLIGKGNDTVVEILLTDEKDFMPVIVALHTVWDRSGLTVRLPAYQDRYIREIYPVAESFLVTFSMSYNVLHYKTVCDAFLKLKTTYTRVPDGKLNLFVHGYAKDERITLSVKDNVASVTETPAGETADLELGHVDAMNLLFALYSPDRDRLPDFAKLWFPLPIFMYTADEV